MKSKSYYYCDKQEEEEERESKEKISIWFDEIFFLNPLKINNIIYSNMCQSHQSSTRVWLYGYLWIISVNSWALRQQCFPAKFIAYYSEARRDCCSKQSTINASLSKNSPVWLLKLLSNLADYIHHMADV